MSTVKRAIDRRDDRAFRMTRTHTMPREMEAANPASVCCMTCCYSAEDVPTLPGGDTGRAPTRCPNCGDVMGDV